MQDVLRRGRRTEAKNESQFIFDDATVDAFRGVLTRAGFQKCLFIGCPTLHARFRRKLDCFLMDIDERFVSTIPGLEFGFTIFCFVRKRTR